MWPLYLQLKALYLGKFKKSFESFSTNYITLLFRFA